MGMPIVSMTDGDYQAIREFLGIELAGDFWHLNDKLGLSFREIAAEARKMWGYEND